MSFDSSEEYVDKLMPSLRAWESAAKLIVDRENLMAKLETHETTGKLNLGRVPVAVLSATKAGYT